MRIIADFHIHSPYARAVSKDMTLENLDYWARLKGITVLGTGDFTHPAWVKELKSKLEPKEKALYGLKKQFRRDGPAGDTRFILTVEISSIYSKGGRGRRIHNLIFFPSLESVEKFNTALGWQANLKSDGRPIVGVDSMTLIKMALDVDPEAFFVPAHIWTPWFSLFGSKSGFDTVEDCFEEYAKYIFALETGLSSDPAMNWRLAMLDRYSLLSNSDSHSLRRIGREANIFDCELSYGAIIAAIKSKDPSRFLSTVEYFPEEGMYHFDGHRLCKTRMHPRETKKAGSLCPVCGRSVTVGVLNRVGELADRPEGFRPERAIPFKNMVPLDEIIADSLGVASATTKKVEEEYQKLVKGFGGEFTVLFDASRESLADFTKPEVVEGIMRVRGGKLVIDPGYDGEYGKVKIFGDEERKKISAQSTLFGLV